jgi:para-nitrobenzyl esterase
MGYWKNTADRGDPNGDGEPRWAKVSSAKAEVMRLGAACGPMPAAEEAKLAFWKRYFASAQSKSAPVF